MPWANVTSASLWVASLLAALGAQPRLRLLHRPANLEDLFLKLTGRQIRAEG